MLTGGDPEGEVREDRVVRPVGEGDVLKDDLTGAAHLAARADRGGRALVEGQLLNLDGLLEQFTDPLNGGEAPLDLGEALRQLAQGVKEALGIKDEGGQGAEAHGAGGHHPAPQGQHEGDRPEGHPLDQGGDRGVVKDRAVDGTAVGIRGAGEAGGVVGLAPEHLHHLQALEVLLQIRVQLGELLADAVVGLAVALLQPEHRQGDGQLHRQQQHPQARFDRDHRSGDHQQGDQVRQQSDGATAEDLSEGIDVTGQSGQQLADRRPVMEAKGEIHRMGEQIVPNPCGQPLADGLNVEALQSLQTESNQDRHQQQQHQGAQLARKGQGLEPGQHGLLAQG